MRCNGNICFFALLLLVLYRSLVFVYSPYLLAVNGFCCNVFIFLRWGVGALMPSRFRAIHPWFVLVSPCTFVRLWRYVVNSLYRYRFLIIIVIIFKCVILFFNYEYGAIHYSQARCSQWRRSFIFGFSILVDYILIVNKLAELLFWSSGSKTFFHRNLFFLVQGFTNFFF